MSNPDTDSRYAYLIRRVNQLYKLLDTPKQRFHPLRKEAMEQELRENVRELKEIDKRIQADKV